MRQPNSSRIHVMQIVGSQVGGIRKHIHSILLNLHEEFKFSYAYSTVTCDARFHTDLKQIVACIDGELVQLAVERRPTLGDVVNLAKIGRYLMKADIQILHGHGAKGGLYARVLGRLLGIKTIYTPHGGTVHEMFGRAGKALYTSVEKVLFPWTDYFLFESVYTANAYRQKVGKTPLNWQVNHNGVKATFLRPTKSGLPKPKAGQAVKIGVFGMIRPEKGQIYAVRALPIVLARNFDVSLHIFGSGPDKELLVETVQALGLQDKVVFWGDIVDVESRMQDMDLILIPSLFESFGYVAVEAMSLEKPLIATRVGGLREVADDGVTALLVEAANPEAIASALITYLADTDKMNRHAMAGFERFQALFTEERMCRAVADTYKRVIPANKGAFSFEANCSRQS